MNSGPSKKNPKGLIAEAQDIFAINMELGGQLEQAYLHVSEHILKNLTNMEDFLKQEPFNLSHSTKLLLLTREIYFANTAFEVSTEQAHVSAGQYFIEHSKDLANEVEPKPYQEESTHEPLKGKRSLLTSYESQSSKRAKQAHENKPTFAIERSGGVNGQEFFWYQQDESDQYDDNEEVNLSDDLDIDYSDLYSYDHELPEASVSRIMTNEEHISRLNSILRDADNYVMIASYGISIEMLNQIKDDIIRLRSKGVGIHFFNSDQKPCSPEVMQFIHDNKICYEVIQTHAKFLFTDGHIAAIGSFNWLASDSSRYQNGKNGTLVISGKQICAGLTSQIMVYMRQYIYKRQGNFTAMSSFRDLETTNTPIYFELNDGSKLTYLATLDAHRLFLNSAFNIARNTLTICCPFINASSGFLNDLPPTLLAKTANRGVKIRIMCNRPDVYKLNQAYSDLLKLHRNIEVMPTEHLHQKTLLVDDHLIAEGSFNWMSASRDETSRFHNCELTMVYEGSKAKILIDAFNKSMGLQEKPALSDNRDPDVKTNSGIRP
ncbi:MAG: phospholipase D-like domain-containing protein [Candidatus Berkiella sp.]